MERNLERIADVRQKHLTAEATVGEGVGKAVRRNSSRKGDALIPQLRGLGMKAFAASKDDRNIERFLIQILDDDIAHDRYEDAAVLSKSLLDSGCEVKKVIDHAGVAAFCTNDFDGAEKYLKEAQNAGTIGDQRKKLLVDHRGLQTVLGNRAGIAEKGRRGARRRAIAAR